MLAAISTQWLKLSLKREDGQAMAEYGIILALIAAVVIGLLVILGGDIKTALTTLTSQL
jgi:pilus assembly protein Flp/PilA